MKQIHVCAARAADSSVDTDCIRAVIRRMPAQNTVVLAILVGLAAASAASAQTGEWFVTEYSNELGYTHVFHEGVEVRSWQWANPVEMAIYADPVSGTVSQAPYPGGTGSIYDTSGGYLGGLSFTASTGGEYDGAWDGTNSYMVSFDSGGDVQMLGPNFSGAGTVLFNWHSAVTAEQPGITYDSVTGTLWTCDWTFFSGHAEVHQWTTGGTLLNSFPIPSTGDLSALAYDANDDTFWVADGSGLVGIQFDRSGAILDTIPMVLSTGSFAVGGEIGAIPEPASLLLFGLVVMPATRRRRVRGWCAHKS